VLSIVIPTSNAEDTIGELLESIKAQDYFIKTKGLRNKLNLLLVFSPKPVKVYFVKRWYYSDLKREDKVLSQLLMNKA
jgi:cellulose synthase/poly-beta-1,6-N-acetylglucosamine synthase-like glycosyltransferase